jgi:hypothetical protein
MRHLIASLVPLAAYPIGLPHKANGETSFSIDETDDPANCDQSFLLIAWLFINSMKNASWIVSSASLHRSTYRSFLAYEPEDAPGIPANSQISLRQHSTLGPL